ncbi:MAG TPA: CoA-binding protein [bacterium]|nr:CoA-binding protein [bacterium]
MSKHPLQTILAPESVAFLGASNNLLTMGTVQMHNIMASGYQGKLYPVHPKLDRVLGLKAYPSIESLPDGIEVAVMVLPTRLVPETLEQCGKKGIKHGTIISGGFAERGGDGAELQRKMEETAKRYDIKFNGPNCIGVCNVHQNYNNTWFRYKGRKGGISLASQSGTYACHMFSYLDTLGAGLGKTISVGNEATLDLVDCLEYFENDPETKVIALYVEGIRRGREFIKTARRVARKKPIVALYIGGTEAGARAGASHTAVLSGPDELYEGVFRQSGILRASTVEQLFDWCWALSEQPVPEGNNIVILTNAGGPGSSMADAAERSGLNVPLLKKEIQDKLREHVPATASTRNPIDITYAVNMQELFMQLVPKLLLAQDDVDGILLYGVMDASIFIRYGEETGLSMDVNPEALRQAWDFMSDEFSKIPFEFGKPIIGATFYNRYTDKSVKRLQDNGIPFLPSPERAVGAMSALYRYGRIRRWLENQA